MASSSTDVSFSNSALQSASQSTSSTTHQIALANHERTSQALNLVQLGALMALAVDEEENNLIEKERQDLLAILGHTPDMSHSQQDEEDSDDDLDMSDEDDSDVETAEVIDENTLSTRTSRRTTAVARSIYSLLGIENISKFFWQLTGITGGTPYCADSAGRGQDCKDSLSPGDEQWLVLQTATDWADLEYNAFASENSRVYKLNNFTEATQYSNYQGHFGISFTTKAVTVSNQEDVFVTIGPYKSGAPQDVDVISATPAPTPMTVTKAPDNTDDFEEGDNHSGFEWGNNPSQTNPPTVADIDDTFRAGDQGIRVPFKLEYSLDSNGKFDANSAYAKQYQNYVNTITDNNGQATVEAHNYDRLNGEIMTPAQCEDCLGGLASLFKDNSRVKVELMNEPHDVDLNTLSACYDAAIRRIRSNGFKGRIIIEGSVWGTPSAWVNADGTPSDQFNTLNKFFNDTATYGDVAMGIHCYFNGNSGGGDGLSECVPAENALTLNRIPQLTGLCHNHSIPVYVTEYGVINSNNCLDVLKNFLTHLYDNRDVYYGGHWWTQTPSNSAAWGANGYPLLVNPNNNNDPRAAMRNDFKKEHGQNPIARAFSTVSSFFSAGNNNNVSKENPVKREAPSII